MGAWGLGPFDSDTALDSLGDLAHSLGVTYEMLDDPTPVNVDQGRMLTKMRQLLADDDPANRYAAAGLVAAVLEDVPDTNTGTRIFSNEPGLHLTAHCGYAALLAPTSARALLPPAITAVETLRSDTRWLTTWVDGDGITQLVSALLELLHLLAAAS